MIIYEHETLQYNASATSIDFENSKVFMNHYKIAISMSKNDITIITI